MLIITCTAWVVLVQILTLSHHLTLVGCVLGLRLLVRIGGVPIGSVALDGASSGQLLIGYSSKLVLSLLHCSNLLCIARVHSRHICCWVLHFFLIASVFLRADCSLVRPWDFVHIDDLMTVAHWSVWQRKPTLRLIVVCNFEIRDSCVFFHLRSVLSIASDKWLSEVLFALFVCWN